MALSAFSTLRYLRIVRASGWYDLLITWPFALPWTFALLYTQLGALGQALGLPGELHPLEPAHMLLANLMGSVIVVWSIARILEPTVLLGRLDGVARLLFSTWMIYAVAQGGNAVVLGFVLVELLFGVVQWWRVAAQGRAPVSALAPAAT